MKKPAIAIALGVPKKPSDDEDEEYEKDEGEDEGDDTDAHGEALMQELCDADEKRDYKKMWSVFKTAQALADDDSDEGEE